MLSLEENGNLVINSQHGTWNLPIANAAEYSTQQAKGKRQVCIARSQYHTGPGFKREY